MAVRHPNEIHQAFLDAVNAKDLDAILDLYEPDGIAVGLDGVQHRGEAALRAMFADLLSVITHFEGSTRRVLVMGDVALTSAEWRGELVGPDGEVQEATGTTAELLRRQPDGTWRMVVDDPAFTT